MTEQRTLELRLILDNQEPVSPAEFLELFRCADDFARHIAQQEALALLHELDVPGDKRLAMLQQIHQLGRRMPSPAEVKEIERGSWVVVVTIAAPILLFILKEYVHPVVQLAWTESDMRARLLSFLQNRVFVSAKRKAEEKAIEAARYGNLQIVRIEGTTDEGSEPSITIRLERRTIMEVRLSDKELVEEFVKRFRAKR